MADIEQKWVPHKMPNGVHIPRPVPDDHPGATTCTEAAVRCIEITKEYVLLQVAAGQAMEHVIALTGEYPEDQALKTWSTLIEWGKVELP